MASDRWEYRIVKFNDGRGEQALADMGERGWELVAVVVQFNAHFAYLKRRAQP